MFTLRSITDTISHNSRRLGLGLAVAVLAISTVAAPVSAATPESHQALPMAQQEGSGPIVIPMKADLEVLARGKRKVGNSTQYHFLIRNNGPANAPQIVGYKEAQTKALIGDGFNITDNGYFNFGLNAGQSKAVTVNCTPQANYYCSQGTVLVFMNNQQDPDFSNDMAVIH